MFFKKKGKEAQELLELNKVSSKDSIKLANRVLVAFCVKCVIVVFFFYKAIQLIIAGITSDSTIKISFKNDFNLELNKALPGVTFAIIVILFAIFVNYKIRIKKK